MIKKHSRYRIVAEYTNGFKVVGLRFSRASAVKFAREFMARLDPNTDDCPEMIIEAVYAR